jgi:hypothetical protein
VSIKKTVAVEKLRETDVLKHINPKSKTRFFTRKGKKLTIAERTITS